MKFTTLLGAVSIAALTTGLNAQDADLLVFDYSGFELPEHHAAYIAKYGQSPTFAFFRKSAQDFRQMWRISAQAP